MQVKEVSVIWNIAINRAVIIRYYIDGTREILNEGGEWEPHTFGRQSINPPDIRVVRINPSGHPPD